MTDLTAAQDQEVTFLTGIAADGTIAPNTFWSWNRDDPATYSPHSDEAKWGASTIGTGATISVAFDADSHWSQTESNAFLAAMHLWSDVANVHFVVASDQANADVVINRTSDGGAHGGIEDMIPGAIGGARLGIAIDGSVNVDTSVPGFGPLGNSFSTYGGYPWLTILHEFGHALGLGHGGPYNDGDTATTMLGGYDSTAWTVMSYTAGDDFLHPGAGAYGWGTAPDGYPTVALTPMPLDIAALQRIYGAPTDTPLSGGQVFGFHSNIQGDTAPFFDFTVNTRPVVTLFDTGTGNTLDLSGYNVASDVDLHDGAFSSVGGMEHDIAIAYGTRIDTAIGGTYSDALTGNDDGDVLMGNAGADILKGGSGNDHIYGNMASTLQGMADGNDVIDAGDGSNYVNGNAGNDMITAGDGTNRLYGGAGDDRITATGIGINHLNGNLGNDLLQVTAGTNDVRGGQGDDQIMALGGTNTLNGDAGNDVISGGAGADVMTGGAGSDLFVLIGVRGGPANPAGQYDEITDFADGIDHLHIDGWPLTALPTLLHAANNQNFDDVASAEAYAAQLMATTASPSGEVAALQVGSDTFLFYAGLSATPDTIDSIVRIDHVAAGNIGIGDFVLESVHF